MTIGDQGLAVFDIETTGIDTETARIVSACVAVLDSDGSVTRQWEWLADPGVAIPEGASAVHGITTEYAQKNGRPSVEVVSEITETLRALFSAPTPVVVYNAPYDFTVLDRECRRHGLAPIDQPAPVIDPLVIDKAVDRYRKGKRTLEAAAVHYGVALDDAHNASADAIAAGRVAFAILAAHAGVLGDDAHDLHGRQELWFAEQAANFENYMRTQRGQSDFSAPREWPIRPSRVARPIVRVAAAIVTDSRGRAALVRKRDTAVFMQPGGKIEPGESARETIVRELREELGLTVDVERLTYLGLFTAAAANEPDHDVHAEVFAVSSTDELRPGSEIEELRWVELDDEREHDDLAPLSREHLLPLWRAAEQANASAHGARGTGNE